MFPKIRVRFPPKSSILIGFFIINHPFWGTTIFGNTHIYIYVLVLVVSFKETSSNLGRCLQHGLIFPALSVDMTLCKHLEPPWHDTPIQKGLKTGGNLTPQTRHPNPILLHVWNNLPIFGFYKSMVNVGKRSIHGSYGQQFLRAQKKLLGCFI